jgi:hypothetical protein
VWTGFIWPGSCDRANETSDSVKGKGSCWIVQRLLADPERLSSIELENSSGRATVYYIKQSYAIPQR